MGKYGKTITDSYQEVLEWTVTTHELQEKKKVTKREIKDLENDNEHGMVALKLAQSFGTPKEVKKIQDINKRHQRAGEIESKDQKERDAIARKYYNMAEVYEIGTKEYADHTKNMTPGQTVDEGKIKDIVTDVKDALGKIKHRVSQKGSKFIVSVDSNDEEDAQKAMKNHPLYVAGKLRVIPEETELDESKFYLFDNEKDARDYAKKIKGKYVKGTGKSAGQHAVVKEEIELDEDAMVIDLDYSKNPKGLYNAVLQMSKRLGLTIYNAPQAMKDLQAKGKVRLGGKGANLVKFMKYLNDKGIEPSVDVQKGKMQEKKLTDAEMKKREEIAKAIEKDNPNMPMDKKMAIATATAKRVAEEEEPDKPDTAKKVDQMRDDKKKTRIAQLQLQIAKATETINKLNAQEK